MSNRTRRFLVGGLAALLGVAGTTAVGNNASADGRGHHRATAAGAFTLTILHNNDGESSLLPLVDEATGDSYGGAARFSKKVRELRKLSGWSTYDKGESLWRGNLLLNSGDNFLAGTTYEASQQEGAPNYDAITINRLGYDALAVGNHEFDFGPEGFAELVNDVNKRVKFVSANLDYSGEPALAGLAGSRLVSSTIVREQGVPIGIVGLTTPSLPSISSPGGVAVLTDLAGIAQAEVDALTAKGVRKIILISHLQGLDSEIELAGMLTDVDVVIGGGGDEILADEDDQLRPGDEDDIVGSYPAVATDAAGVEVPVVTTPGNYRYVGMLQITFDWYGDVISWDTEDSGIKVVTNVGPEAVGVDKKLVKQVEEPVAEFIAEIANTFIGTSEVALDCERVEVRGVETNCANLIADSLLSTGQALAADFGVDAPQMAIMNGGGIRGEIDQPAGPISVADTFRLQPFANFVATASDVPAETVRQIYEEGAIRLPDPGDGGFAHIAGGTIVIDPSFPARDADQNTGEQITPGERVRELVLDDGTVLVTGGVTQDVTVDIVGLSFSLGGGDAYPAVDAINLGITDQQSLQRYIEEDLGGVITAADYPVGGEGRLTIL